MKTWVTILALGCAAWQANGQAVLPPNIRATNTLERLQDVDRMGISDVLYGTPLPEGKVIGNTYINPQWQQCTILLYENSKLVEGYPARYDLYLEELEISGRSGIRVLRGEKIKSFVWIEASTGQPEYFVNGKELSSPSHAYDGFFKVLAEGARPLFERIELNIKKADYNIQFNVGSVDDKILKKSEFYTQVDGELIQLPSSRKKLLNVFAGKNDEMGSFMKQNHIAANNGESLKLAFRHYNNLIGK